MALTKSTKSFRMKGNRQKRKANMKPAAHCEAAVGGGAGTAGSAVNGMDSYTGPRVVNGKILPRHLLVAKMEDKVIHINVEMRVLIRDIKAQFEKYLGFEVSMHQTDKKKTYTLDPSDIAEDGLNFGYHVDLQRVVPVPVQRTEDGSWTKHEIRGVLRSWCGRLHEIPGVLRAADDKDKEAKEPDPPADDKGKDAKEPDPPPDEAESDGEPRRKKRHGRPIPAWAPRGVPGAHFTAQLPPKKDEDGNLLPAEYQDVYWHQGM